MALLLYCLSACSNSTFDRRRTEGVLRLDFFFTYFIGYETASDVVTCMKRCCAPPCIRETLPFSLLPSVIVHHPVRIANYPLGIHDIFANWFFMSISEGESYPAEFNSR